jgi:hypothetical protein
LEPKRFAGAVPAPTEIRPMEMHLAIQPLIALVAGILVLIVPRLLNYVVAIYLIIIGVLGLFPNLLHHIS